jgi:hypothetical protein
MKDGQKLKLGDAHITPRNIQEVQASNLGDAQGTPFFIKKISVHLSRQYFFIASYAMCCFWSIFIFVFSFFCYVCCNKWMEHNMFVLERDTLRFHCLEHSSFHSYYSASVLFC